MFLNEEQNVFYDDSSWKCCDCLLSTKRCCCILEYVLSNHCKERARERNIPEEEVLSMIRSYQVGCTRRIRYIVRGKIVVVMCRNNSTVVAITCYELE